MPQKVSLCRFTVSSLPRLLGPRAPLSVKIKGCMQTSVWLTSLSITFLKSSVLLSQQFIPLHCWIAFQSMSNMKTFICIYMQVDMSYSQFVAVWMILPCTFMCKCVRGFMFSVHLSKYLIENCWSYVKCASNFIRYCQVDRMTKYSTFSAMGIHGSSKCSTTWHHCYF
jgi:hypothetical protein